MRCLIRGGNWNNTSNAGVFNSNLNNVRGNSNNNIGGRSAFRPKRIMRGGSATEYVGYTLRGAVECAD